MDQTKLHRDQQAASDWLKAGDVACDLLSRVTAKLINLGKPDERFTLNEVEDAFADGVAEATTAPSPGDEEDRESVSDPGFPGNHVRIERHGHDHVWHSPETGGHFGPERKIRVKVCGYQHCGAIQVSVQGADEPTTYLPASFSNACLVDLPQGEEEK